MCPISQPEDRITISSPLQALKPRVNPPSSVTLLATRGHQRSQSSGRGSTSPGYNRDDSIDPSDEDLGIGIGSSIGGCGSSQAGNSEHLSEALSSMSLTSLLPPSTILCPGGQVKKCNSTGSLDKGGLLLSSRCREGRREIMGMELMDPQGFLANPWTGVLGGSRRGEGTGVIKDAEHSLKGKSSSQTTVGSCRKNRWNLLFRFSSSFHFLELNPLPFLSLCFISETQVWWNMMLGISTPNPHLAPQHFYIHFWQFLYVLSGGVALVVVDGAELPHRVNAHGQRSGSSAVLGDVFLQDPMGSCAHTEKQQCLFTTGSQPRRMLGS